MYHTRINNHYRICALTTQSEEPSKQEGGEDAREEGEAQKAMRERLAQDRRLLGALYRSWLPTLRQTVPRVQRILERNADKAKKIAEDVAKQASLRLTPEEALEASQQSMDKFLVAYLLDISPQQLPLFFRLLEARLGK